MDNTTLLPSSASSSRINQTIESKTLTPAPSPPKTPPAHVYQLDFLDSPDTPVAGRYSRLRLNLGLEHPRVKKLIGYIRGPRPKQELPAPKPLLDRTYSVNGRSYTLSVETAVIKLTHRLTTPWLLVLLTIGYIIGFAFFSRAQSFLTPAGSFIDCNAAYWAANDGCGLDGVDCGPFVNSTFDFRCPAQCSQVTLLNPRTVGNEQVDFVPLIVGGGDSNRTYRGDTFVCAAAIQAGLISNSKGGCASLQLVGNFTNFLPFTANGLSSIGFPSVFPLSFQFLPTTSLTHCEDFRNPALAFNVLITVFLFLILRPKPIILFWSLICIGFWHVTLFSQPMTNPPPLDQAFGTFLPALFVAYAFWRLAIRFTLPAFRNAPIEATVWYLGPFWVGVLFNLTASRIPIDRLLLSDIKARPGGLVWLIVIVIVLFFVVLNQVRIIRKTGWLPYYLGWYIIGALVAIVMSQLPGLQFRLHHYIFAIAFIPGTAFPTRLCAIYQGFLLGTFLNGVAAFGFASILQTAADLRRDAPLGSALPAFLTNSITFNSSIALQAQTIVWQSLPDPSEGWDGFALLVDDVERYVGPALNFSLASLQAGIPHFFRLAYTSGGLAGDFTMPASLWPNGTWADPLPGPS